MSVALASPPKLLTAEEYRVLPDRHRWTELRRGVIVKMNPPGFRHGEVCGNLHLQVGNYVQQQQTGRTLTNDAGVVTERGPDTVRGPDVSYYSYQRVPKGQSPLGYASAAPEIVFEVVSPSNTRREITLKVGEYLNAGVNVVCVVDSQYQTINLYYSDRPSEKLQGEDLLSFSDLPGFSLPVSKLFE